MVGSARAARATNTAAEASNIMMIFGKRTNENYSPLMAAPALIRQQRDSSHFVNNLFISVNICNMLLTILM